jgi:DNA polymerase-3 subunit alpha
MSNRVSAVESLHKVFKPKGCDLPFDINNFDDSEVWDLICDGNTKGVFQLESNLGKHWAKQIQPRNIKELAALLSLIRPGTLLARDANGKSMTQVYADRKARKSDSPVEYLHESLEEILKETYGVLVYQEQSMMIAQKLAGFDLKDADALRKAIGKKKADLMEKVKKSFLEGAASQEIVTKEVAEEIFGWIEKSNRYAFNKSHAVSYAINAYWSAYCKTHRLKKFYEKYLNHSEKKPKPDVEKKQLIMDAKRAGIEVLPPRLQHLHEDFFRHPLEDTIVFGLRHVKNVGKESEKIIKYIEKHDVQDYNWMDCLIHMIHGLRLNKRAAIALISVGAFNGKNNRENRQKMLYEFDSWKQLSAREQQSIVDNYTGEDPSMYCDTLAEAIECMTKTLKVNSRRYETVIDIKKSLENPFYDVADSSESIATSENKFLSCSLTCGKTDGLDTNISINMCNEVLNRTIIKKANIAVEITNIKIVKTKKGKNPGQTMAFLTVEDSSGSLDSVTIFPDSYQKYKDLLVEENTVLIRGEVSKMDRSSLIANDIKQI